MAMGGRYHIEDSKTAEFWLKSFPAGIRERGLDYIRKNLLLEIRELSPGTHYDALIQGNELYTTEVSWSPLDGWSGHCECPYGYEKCKHVFALMHWLLEGSKVRNRKSTTSKRWQLPQLSEAFNKLTGLPASPLMSSWLQNLLRIYNSLSLYQGALSADQLRELGIRPSPSTWGALSIWTEFPDSPLEMGMEITAYALEQDFKLTEGMAPLITSAAFRTFQEAWRERRSLQRWSTFLDRIDQLQLSDDILSGQLPVFELRLQINPSNSILLAKGPGELDFKPVRPTESDPVYSKWSSGRGRIHEEGQLLLDSIDRNDLNSFGEPLLHHVAEDQHLLHRVLSSPVLRPLLVDPNLRPIEMAEEPLVWRLTQDQDSAKRNYHLCLQHKDGRPVKNFSQAFYGPPHFYLLGNILHEGPHFDGHQLHPNKINPVPATIVESSPGIRMLHLLQADLPEELQSRIHSLHLSPRLTLRSHPSAPDRIHAMAEAVDDKGQVHMRLIDSEWKSVEGGIPLPEDPNTLFCLHSQNLTAGKQAIRELKGSYMENGWFNLHLDSRSPESFNLWLKSLPSVVQTVLEDGLQDFCKSFSNAEFRLEATSAGNDWFDLSLVLQVEDTDLSQEQIQMLLKAAGKWVHFPGKGWRRLDFQYTEQQDRQLAELGLSPRQLSGDAQRLHALQLASPSAKPWLQEETALEVRRKAEAIRTSVTPEIPSSIQAELRPYQVEGFHFLAYLSTNQFGGILADDMGLGKTLQTLTWLAWLHEQGSGGPSMVVCPKSVMENWQSEATRFHPTLRVRVWHPGELETLSSSLQEADLHVINYNQLRSVVTSIQSVPFLSIILDEGQNIKNPNSLTAKAACSLKAQHRLVLTGTPIENRLLDLWSLLHFAMPGVLGNRSSFSRLYNDKNDPLARVRLASRVRPFLIRRTKSQVAQDLPDRIEEDLLCEMEGDQLRLYEAEKKFAQQLLLGIKTKKELDKLRFHFLTSLLKLRQICCHPLLAGGNHRARSAKVDALLETLQPLVEEGQKVLVFSQFVEMLSLLEPHLKKLKCPIWKLTGSTENRGQLVQDFQSSEGAGIFLISLKAGGAGLNLTAASYVILLDPWWNPAVENQAIDRTHRIGQSRNVIAYRLIMKNTVEEKIRVLQKSKSELVEAVLGEERFAQALTLEDMKHLLED